MLCPLKNNSNTIELTVDTSCYWVLDLLCVKSISTSFRVHAAPESWLKYTTNMDIINILSSRDGSQNSKPKNDPKGFAKRQHFSFHNRSKE